MEPFKNIFNEKQIQKVADEIYTIYPEFKKEDFFSFLINDNWEKKELKERMRAITLALGRFLPKKYLNALNILTIVQKKFNGLFHLVFTDFLETYGLEYYDESIEALRHFTPQGSSEFAVRPFLIKYPHFIEVFKTWAKDENEHVRRLASEGCRPRLPWAIALPQYKKDPSCVLEILELLKNDTSEYVRKSVANNLNDISKDHPKLAKEIFKKWYGISQNTNKIIKHGARTLLKDGDKDVLELFGYSSKGISISHLEVDKNVKLNDYLNFSFTISSKKILGKLRLEYKIGLLRQKGKINYKVFKISEREVKSKELLIKKSHHFKEVTTRRYYSGIHSITIVINGKEFDTQEFKLL